MNDQRVVLDGSSLTRCDVLRVARREAVPVIAPEALERVRKAARFIEEEAAGAKPIYGVTTGFGRNADRIIDAHSAEKLQRNLILSHMAGVGEPLPREVVRALLVIRLNTLLKGHSGIREATVALLLALLERGVHPVIPCRGSVGASGDLAPLSHMAAVLLGEGEAEVGGERLPGREALAAAGLEPVTLSYKEGLALINGTSLMAALAILACGRIEDCLRLADLSGALSLEALAGRRDAFDPDVHALRPHPGQMRVAANVLSLTEGSTLLDIPYEDVPRADGSFGVDPRTGSRVGGKPPKPQDAYSFRCMPQVHGAVRDAFDAACAVVDRELNAVTDNPILFPAAGDDAGKVISAGNFHGMPLALAMAGLKAALPALGSISERRVAALVDESCSDGLPRFLVPGGDGADSGVMLLQYTAASLVNALATRAHPAAVHSIPTCANTEDHVSMGVTEGLDLLDMTDHLLEVLAIEFIVAAQAVDLRRRLLSTVSGDPEVSRGPGRVTGLVLERIRSEVPFIARDEDLDLPEVLSRMRKLVRGDALLRVAADEGVAL